MGKRVDFTTTEERIAWLKSTAARQEISVSQLLNRLIRNRMKNEDRYIKKSTTEYVQHFDNDENNEEPTKILSKTEILAEIEKAHQTNELDDEDDLPF